MIASVAFRNFKALRSASLRLAPFNLVLGPNGSGKTSLIEALLHLRGLAALPPHSPAGGDAGRATAAGPALEFQFLPPFEGMQVKLSCIDDEVCNALEVTPPGAAGWPALRAEIGRIRSFDFDHAAMAGPVLRKRGTDLLPDGTNLASVLAEMRDTMPAAFAAFQTEAMRLFPEFSGVALTSRAENHVELSLTLAGEGKTIDGTDLSQGMLYTFGILVLAFAPVPPSVVCIEEVDRGIHPRMLREIRDALYRLTYPDAFELARPPVQVIATTHSPYLLDLFRDHPEEIVLTQKHGRAAHFERLADRADLSALLEGSTLGDLWFSGILGAVPEEQ